MATVASRHEMWRDEVRAWSRARAGDSVLAMIGGLRHEGHPVVWYALLRGADFVVHSPIVLPVVSGAVAVAAVVIFLRAAPFSFRWKAAFVFGAFPIFEYSVMCRNYGLGMLVLFVVAWLYPRRFDHPIGHGALLFVLANTSAHAAILAGALAVAWAFESSTRRPDGVRRGWTTGVVAGLALTVAGIVVCLFLAFPEVGATATSVRRAGLGTLTEAAVKTVWQAVPPFDPAVLGEVPAPLFGISGEAIGRIVSALIAVVVVVGLAELLSHADLALGFGTAAFGLLYFFRVVYPGSVRHLGLLLVMLVCLEWIARQRESHVGGEPATRRIVLRGTLIALLALHLVAGIGLAARDYARPLSSSQALAALIDSRPEYRDAIIVGEPDTYMESLPYYVDTRLFSVRENRFFRWVTYSASARELSLGGLLDGAEALSRTQHAVVLLVIGHLDVLARPAGRTRFGYGLSFTWSDDERRRLQEDTRAVAVFADAVTDENYAVFVIRP